METEMEIKQKLQSAINGFGKNNLFDGSINLFKILGYNTERQSRLDNSTLEGFCNSFIDGNNNIPDPDKFRKKALAADWQSIELLFQLTEAEMSNQGSLFDTGKVDNTIIEAYLFFAVELKNTDYSRTKLADITRQLNKVFPMPVMVLFKYGKHLTLSVIKRRLHKKDDTRDVLEKVTLIKDININNTHRAHIEILFDLSLEELRKKYAVTNFVGLYNAWQKTLDSSELNKKFYKELANWYFWAVQNVEFPDDDEKDRDVRNATNIIRLLTRLIFVWFLKEKGLVPKGLFDRSKLDGILNFNDKKESTFYKAILQNLFFGTLNQTLDKRGFRRNGQNYNITTLYRYKNLFVINDNEILSLFKDIPFLNGGLFECLDKPHPTEKTPRGNEKIVRIDGFSDRDDNKLKVPDNLFFDDEHDYDLNEVYGTKNKNHKVKGLITLLDKYKFTIAENTPIEEEIALDPELLGKVFENLLASYNPETQTTARKQTGSFYTPREIVDYMVDESLKAALSDLVSRKINTATKDDIKTGLDILFEYTEKEHAFNELEVLTIVKAISELKILDPACGSGAFPMGVLHKLVFILNKLDHSNKIWLDLQKQEAVKDTEDAYNLGDKEERHQRLREIEDAFDLNTSDYGRKLFLIENSIYGVDIQPVAVQISMLRFFISLVVEQNIDKEKENLGIKPLPNLETKFVAANTLIGIDKPKQGNFADLKTKDLEKELLNIRHKHFNAKTQRTKRKYRKEDKEIRHKIAQILKDSGWPSDTAEMLADWDPYDQNHFADFFDMEWMFGIKSGFDIIIGNPPYVQIQKFSGKQEQKNWEQQKFATFVKTGDIYCLFYERGNMLLRDNGVLVFITSNKWMRANYGKKTRKYFTEKTNPLVLIDFGGYKIFESATVDTNILIFGKNKNRHSTNACAIGKDYSENISISDYMTQHSIKLDNLNEESWIISSKEEYAIKKRIEKIGTPLKDWDLSINYGIKTGFNEAFIIDGVKKDKLIAADPKNAEIIKPILRGRDIKRYKAEFADLWLINTNNGYFDDKIQKRVPPIEIDDYPIIKKYLDQFLEKLEKRQDKGVTPYNLRNCAYIEEFEKEKIAWGNLSLHSQFNLIQKGQYINAPSPFITSGSKYLLSVLNSSIGDHYIRLRGVTRNGGYFEYKPMFIEHLPIPKIPSESQKPFEIIVDCILFAKKNNLESEASTLESVIDGMVYDLYFEDEMKKANCYITDRITGVVQPFKKNDTDDFKKEYIEKFVKFCNEDKTVFRGLIHRRTVEVVKIVSGAKK